MLANFFVLWEICCECGEEQHFYLKVSYLLLLNVEVMWNQNCLIFIVLPNFACAPWQNNTYCEQISINPRNIVIYILNIYNASLSIFLEHNVHFERLGKTEVKIGCDLFYCIKLVETISTYYTVLL